MTSLQENKRKRIERTAKKAPGPSPAFRPGEGLPGDYLVKIARWGYSCKFLLTKNSPAACLPPV